MIDETGTNQPPMDAGQTSASGYAAGAGAAPSGSTYGNDPQNPYAAAGVPPPPVTSLPSPALAGWLGLIPGVGAMYNGQFAKGLAHFVIFMVLVALSKDVDIFGLAVAGWVVYQAIEAHHTARAKRDGQPLPNAFGLNDIGDRLGFGKNWPGSSARGPMGPADSPVTQWTPTTPPAGSVTYPPPPVYAQQAPPSDWVGYVPPTAFASAPPVPPPSPIPIPQQAQTGAGWGHVPYAETYSGVPPVVTPPVVVPQAGRFPVAALWLIGLGLLFSVHNWVPMLTLNMSWVAAVVLAATAIFMMQRKVRVLGGWSGAFDEVNRPRLVCGLRGPVMLMVLAVMFALQGSDIARFGQTWPVLLIALGVLILLERTVGASPVVYAPAAYAAPVNEGVTPAGMPVAGDDSTKGGQ